MSIYHVTSFDHLTVDTGHSAPQTRDGIGPGVTVSMKGGVLAGRLAMHGLLFLSRAIPGGWAFTIGEDGGPKDDPLVMCHVAAPGCGASVWAAVRADRKARELGWSPNCSMPGSSAWMAVSILPGMMSSLSAFSLIPMLGDAERCFAWTLFDHGAPGSMVAAV